LKGQVVLPSGNSCWDFMTLSSVTPVARTLRPEREETAVAPETTQPEGSTMKYVQFVFAVLVWTLCTSWMWASPPDDGGEIRLRIPALRTNNRTLNDAYRIAIGDLVGNVMPFKSGLLERPAPVILAGLDYGRPWTRDASINAWNGASLIMPEIARNTLLSVVERSDGGIRIGGQYWDCIVWATGAWHHYLYTTGLLPFLRGTIWEMRSPGRLGLILCSAIRRR
jgi:hypothetical protein